MSTNHGMNPIIDRNLAIAVAEAERLRLTPFVGCTKHRYPDKKSAVTAINNRTKGHQRNRPGLLRAYPCPRCAGWHLTHEERR